MAGKEGTPPSDNQDQGWVRAHVDAFTYGRSASGNSPYGPIEEKPVTDALPPCLSDIHVDFPPGSFTLLCGASGSGKSTILRLFNGLVPHFHTGILDGSVHVSGVNVPETDLSQAGRTTSTVFQNPRTQFFTSDVLSELAFRGENYGIHPEEILRRASEALHQLGIEHLWSRPLAALSGGELQKVACAQAIVAQTPVLLLDEPTSNLSPAAIAEFADILRQLKNDGITIIIAEHRIHFLRDLIDQAILIDRGRIITRYTAEEFCSLDEETREKVGLRTLVTPPSPENDPTWVPAPHPAAPLARGLHLSQMRFSYGGTPVLNIDQLHFSSGEVTAIIGDNGVGKSTLCRIVVGLEKADKGSSIELHGQITSPRQRLSESAMVMQDVHRQLFSATVRQEILLGLSQDHKNTVNVEALLERFDLADFEQRHPLSLSGGQKQRLTVAAAAARGAAIHVFDEPTSGVDHRQLVEIGRQLRELAEAGSIVLVVTHDPELVAVCADRVVQIHRLNQSDPTHPQVTTLVRREEKGHV
ncbi:MAG: ABC transporter ATP-binding protein [Actinomycetaceae bacterium]|nr:ABC transporter ATP-binding protein [Actinomycetaceae bacterium]